MKFRCSCGLVGSQDVRVGSCCDVGLDDRNMLIRGSVKDGLDIVSTNRLLEHDPVTDIPEHELDRYVSGLWNEIFGLVEFLFQRIQVEFRLFDRDEFGRTDGEDLATEFAANGAAGSGHKYAATCERFLEQFLIGGDHCAVDEIFDIELSKVIEIGESANKFSQRRHSQYLEASGANSLKDLTPYVSVHGRDCKEHSIDSTSL